MIVYADILFLVNFSMDFLALWLTGKILHIPLKKGRTVVGALFGGILGTTWTVFDEGTSAPLTVLLGFVLSAGMCLIAFSKSTWRSYLRGCFAVWGAGILLGGIMTCVLSLGEPVYMAENGRADYFLPVFLLCFGVCQLFIRLFSAGKAKRTAQVQIWVGERTYPFMALADSGSFAADPLSGLPVIILGKGRLPAVEAKLQEPERGGLRIRLIPVSGIGGETLLKGFLPDCVTVDGQERAAVIAISEAEAEFAGQDGILPAALL